MDSLEDIFSCIKCLRHGRMFKVVTKFRSLNFMILEELFASL